MTTTSPPGSQNVQDALTYGCAGRLDLAGEELKKVVAIGPIAFLAAISAFAAVAVADQKPQSGEFMGLHVEYAGQPASTADAPRPVRFAAQVMAARANDDQDTVEALFRAELDQDPAGLADALRIVFDAAVATVRDQINRA